jgi:hypothetical protein
MCHKRDSKKDIQICSAATPGPWKNNHDYAGETVFAKNSEVICFTQVKENNQFIAESRDALPYWIKRAIEADKLLSGISDDIVCGNMACRGGKWYRKINEFLGGGER